MLRRARPPARDAAPDGGPPAGTRRHRPGPGGPQLRRGGGAHDLERPPHGLNGGRPDHPPGRPHGAAHQPWHDAPDRRHPAPGGGVRRGEAARRDAGQGAPGPGGGLRADQRGTPPLAALRSNRAGAHPVRRPGRGGRAAARGARPRGAGAGQVVAIVGEPGVGKSRLVWEVTHSHRTRGWQILQAGSVSYGKATPYLPVVSLLRGYFQIGDRDEPRAIREKSHGQTPHARPRPRAGAAGVPHAARRAGGGPPLGGPGPTPAAAAHDRRAQAAPSAGEPGPAALGRVRGSPLDRAETQGALDRLVESVPTARILLLVNYRPEYRHDWGGKTYYRQLRLDPLAPENATALLETLLGDDA